MQVLPQEDLEDGMVRLRAPRRKDAEQITRACADPATVRFIPAIPDPYTMAHAVEWITEAAPRSRAAGGAQFVIADPATDQVLGATGLHDVSRVRATAETGYWVAPWARGRGVATAATRLLSRWAHQQGLYRLELLTEPENWPSQKVALAAGYRWEGLRHAATVARDGSGTDMVVWYRLATDPDTASPRLVPDLPGGRLTDGRILLRPLWSGDAGDTFRLRALPEMVASSVPPQEPTPESVARRCALAMSHWLAGQRADLTIRDAADDRYLGEISLYYQEPVTGQAMIGYGLLPEARGRGAATRAARLLADWAFQQAGIARLVAGTAPGNLASQRVLERAGFRREGYQRQRLPGPAGSRIDDVLYGLVPEDLTPTRTPSR